MHPLLESLRGAVPDACENYWHLGSVSGEPAEQNLQARGQCHARCEPQAGDIGELQEFQPPPDQSPLREQGAPALVLGKVKLRRAADHMQARLHVPPDGGHCARTPVPHQRCGRELHWRAAKQHEVGVQHGHWRRLPTRHPRPQPTGLVNSDSVHRSIFGVLKRSFSVRRKLRFRTPSFVLKRSFSFRRKLRFRTPSFVLKRGFSVGRKLRFRTPSFVLKRGFSVGRKLRFRTPSFEAELQRWAEAALPHSKFRRTAEKFAGRKQEYP